MALNRETKIAIGLAGIATLGTTLYVLWRQRRREDKLLELVADELSSDLDICEECGECPCVCEEDYEEEVVSAKVHPMRERYRKAKERREQRNYTKLEKAEEVMEDELDVEEFDESGEKVSEEVVEEVLVKEESTEEV